MAFIGKSKQLLNLFGRKLSRFTGWSVFPVFPVEPAAQNELLQWLGPAQDDGTVNDKLTVIADAPEYQGSACLQFSGTITDYVNVSAAVSASINYPFHMCAWFRRNANTGTECLVSMADSTATDKLIQVLLLADGRVQALRRNGGALLFITGTTFGFNDDDWHYVEFIMTSASAAELFVDGVSEGDDTRTYTDPGTFDRARLGLTSDSTVDLPFGGKLSECCMGSDIYPCAETIDDFTEPTCYSIGPNANHGSIVTASGLSVMRTTDDKVHSVNINYGFTEVAT